MALALSFVGIVKSSGVTGGSEVNDQTNGELILDFLGTLSGSYTAGGEPLDFTTAPPSGFQLPSVAPSDVHITELGVIGTETPGFNYNYVYGPTLAAPTEKGGAIQIKGTGTATLDGGNAITGTYASQTPSLDAQKLKIRAFFAKSS